MKNLLGMLSFFLISITAQSQDFTEQRIDGGISTFASIDFNGDGKKDLAGIAYKFVGPSDLQVWLNISDDVISFDLLTVASSESFNGSPAVADFDNDGDIDIAVSFDNSRDVFLYRSNGNNTYELEEIGVDGVNQLEFLDIEGDGDLDLAGYVFNDNLVKIFINDGNGNLFEEIVIEHQNDISDLDFGDIDADGDLDFVLSVDKFSGETIALYVNDGMNVYEKFTTSDINALNSAVQVEMIDFNRDGKMDFVGLNDKKLTAFLQSDIFGFVPLDVIEPNNIGDLLKFEIGDFDGNGSWDVVIGDFNDDLHWYKNQLLTFNQTAISEVTPIYNLLSEDFDLDGDLDFIASNGDFWIYTNEIEQMPSSVNRKILDQINIGPNPFTDKLSIDNLDGEIASIHIYDIVGSLIYSKAVSGRKVEIDLSNLSSGVYTLHTLGKDNTIASVGRLIKQ